MTIKHVKMVTEGMIISDLLGTGNANFQDMREQQLVGYRSGRALKRHVESAHKGIENPDCNACKELRSKCA